MVAERNIEDNGAKDVALSSEIEFPAHKHQVKTKSSIRFIDLFAGIGGLHIGLSQAANNHGIECQLVFASEIDEDSVASYEANFDFVPQGDITKIPENAIPEHEILLAGFPCQPFSIIGEQKGFADTRGTLFFDIARILKARRPKAFILENVKQLRSHDNGRTLATILRVLSDLGYYTHHKVLNALDYGLPQKRERLIIVGFLESEGFSWPNPRKERITLAQIIEPDVPESYFASDKIALARKQSAGKGPHASPSIWHENKSGHIGIHEFSCALRAGASYNYLLLDGVRRLTEREMLRLQGFPESFQIVHGYSITRRQAGNAVPVPMIQDVANEVLHTLNIGACKVSCKSGLNEIEIGI